MLYYVLLYNIIEKVPKIYILCNYTVKHNILYIFSFGAGLTSKQTGIILNSVMDDFSFPYFKNYFGLPGSPNNEMKPGKRPLSSMSPTIITDKNGDVKMVVGASGGTKITTTVAQVSFLLIIKLSYFMKSNNNILEMLLIKILFINR